MINNGLEKTTYEWCIERNLRVLGLENDTCLEQEFYTIPKDENTFNKFLEFEIKNKGFKVTNGLHLKSEKYLELRMYSIVPYNLLGIQKGIQHEHGTTQFVVDNIINPIIKVGSMNERYVRWATEWKTSIILNGGTSNEGHYVRQGYKHVYYVGTMQKHLKNLRIILGDDVSAFYEPDLNSMLTSITFITDERVFNNKLYPLYKERDFKEWVSEYSEDRFNNNEIDLENKFIELQKKEWEEYIETVGGEQNHELKTYLTQFKLA